MRIACLGGGPAGLTFAIAMKLRDASHEIVVVERTPYTSYAMCGIPYYVAGEIVDASDKELPSGRRVMVQPGLSCGRCQACLDVVMRADRERSCGSGETGGMGLLADYVGELRTGLEGMEGRAGAALGALLGIQCGSSSVRHAAGESSRRRADAWTSLGRVAHLFALHGKQNVQG